MSDDQLKDAAEHGDNAALAELLGRKGFNDYDVTIDSKTGAVIFDEKQKEIPGADLIKQYEKNEVKAWGYTFAAIILAELGVQGEAISELRSSLTKAKMFGDNRNERMVDDIINATVQL